MILDDYIVAGGKPRVEVRDLLWEEMARPIPSGPERDAYDRERWAEKNIAAAAAQSLGGEEDPHLAKPVERQGSPA